MPKKQSFFTEKELTQLIKENGALVTTRKAAQLTGLSKDVFYRAIQRGELPVYGHRGVRVSRLKLADVSEWLERVA